MTATADLNRPVSPTTCPTQPAATRTERKVYKVLHVMNGEVYGGAERALDLLAQRLGEHDIEVGFACIKPNLFPTARHAKDTPLYEVPMRNRFDVRPVRELVRIIREEGYDMVYAHTARSVLVASLASKIAGVPLVYHVQSPTSRDTTNRWKNLVNGLVERLSLRRASALIAVSESMAEHICSEGAPRENVSVVPNGTPCRESVPTRSVPEKCWTLGMTALIRPRKGIEVLLRALAILKERGLAVHFRAVGPFETPEYERKVKALTDELGVGDMVEWVGFTRDVNGQLDKMDVFVLPSLFGEGTPLVVAEAMSAGLPIVSTRVEGIPEQVRDGHDGLIVEPGDAEALADAIARIVTRQVDATALGQSARQRHAERFSDRAMAAGVAKVYRRVLDR